MRPHFNVILLIIENKMKLSFVIVNYKSEKYLQKCLSSIKEKVLGVDYEIIVVNNDTKNIETHCNASLQGGNIKIINSGKNFGFGAAAWVLSRQKILENIIASIPDAEKIVEEKMKQKIPLIVGSDGQLSFPGADNLKIKKQDTPNYMG